MGRQDLSVRLLASLSFVLQQMTSKGVFLHDTLMGISLDPWSWIGKVACAVLNSMTDWITDWINWIKKSPLLCSDSYYDLILEKINVIGNFSCDFNHTYVFTKTGKKSFFHEKFAKSIWKKSQILTASTWKAGNLDAHVTQDVETKLKLHQALHSLRSCTGLYGWEKDNLKIYALHRLA